MRMHENKKRVIRDPNGQGHAIWKWNYEFDVVVHTTPPLQSQSTQAFDSLVIFFFLEITNVR